MNKWKFLLLFSKRSAFLLCLSRKRFFFEKKNQKTFIPKDNASSGFTLLEVLVAFVIAALASILVYKAGVSGAAESAVAARYQEATIRAQSRLASLGTLTALQPMQLSGADGGGYQWRVAIATVQSAPGLSLYAIRVTESFGDRHVTLLTERLGPPSP
jgi:general secretion pathway protein I